MRDVIVILLVFGSLPFILKRPYIGVLVWSWLGYMNPHRLTWGFAYDFPFAQLVGLVTLLALLFDKEKKRIPVTSLVVVWFTFIVWMNITTIFSLVPDLAWGEWDRTMKIQLFSIVTLLVMRTRQRIELLVWVIVISLGFYGVKGGIFSILTGGENLVWGPPGSFIEGNNAMGLALIMIIPLIWYVYLQVPSKKLRMVVLISLALSGLAVLTTHSRGALIAICAMAVFLWINSRHKIWLGLVLLVAAPVFWASMPEQWHERMATIQTYEEDGSAMGRINAWHFAFNLAQDNPVTGGGFQTFVPELFKRYAPDPEDFHDAHSIYFEVLGEHGFVGLGLFLALGVLALKTAGQTKRLAAGAPELRWASDLSSMLQVGLVGYAVGGLFLGLAYFDLYYSFIALIVLANQIARDDLVSARAGPSDARAHNTRASEPGGGSPPNDPSYRPDRYGRGTQPTR